MNVLAIDLSLTATGICHTDGSTETLKTSLRGMPRMEWIVDEVWERTALPHSIHEVDLVVFEDALFSIRNNTVGELVMLHGAIRHQLWRHSTTFAVVPPASLKKYATGAGNAKKPDMRMALYKRAELDLDDDNQVDARWLWMMALDAYGAPVVTLPADQRAAINRITWPALKDAA